MRDAAKHYITPLLKRFQTAPWQWAGGARVRPAAWTAARRTAALGSGGMAVARRPVAVRAERRTLGRRAAWAGGRRRRAVGGAAPARCGAA